jgi:hypothetical protein
MSVRVCLLQFRGSSTQVERYGSYTDRIRTVLSDAEIRTEPSLKEGRLRPYTVKIRPRITVPKSDIVYGALFSQYTAVYGPLLMMVRSVFLRQIYGPNTDRIVRPG